MKRNFVKNSNLWHIVKRELQLRTTNGNVFYYAITRCGCGFSVANDVFADTLSEDRRICKVCKKAKGGVGERISR